MKRASAHFVGFPKDGFVFFRELKRHNNRDWFQANRERYEASCREPVKQLIEALGDDPKEAHITRINRDLRFSRDKSPYRTYIAAGVRGSYIHLSADGLYVGAGFYKGDPKTLDRFRDAIADKTIGGQLAKIVASLRRKGFTVETHERLARVPRGYPPDHPRAELLKMKDIFAGKSFKPAPWMSTPALGRRLETIMKDTLPLRDWVKRHVRPHSDK
ncbi:MAG TPA: DUF2461 domain-containing protein [Gemmatimonadaceae bacterium]